MLTHPPWILVLKHEDEGNFIELFLLHNTWPLDDLHQHRDQAELPKF